MRKSSGNSVPRMALQHEVGLFLLDLYEGGLKWMREVGFEEEVIHGSVECLLLGVVGAGVGGRREEAMDELGNVE